MDNTCSYIQILNCNCVVCFKSINLLAGLVRLRSLCELRRDTEFSKEKYRKRGIFRKFVVAGNGFSDLGSFALLTAILPSGSRRRLNHLLRWFKSSNRYKTKNAPQGYVFYFNWLRGLDLNQRPSGYEPDELPDCSTPR